MRWPFVIVVLVLASWSTLAFATPGIEVSPPARVYVARAEVERHTAVALSASSTVTFLRLRVLGPSSARPALKEARLVGFDADDCRSVILTHQGAAADAETLKRSIGHTTDVVLLDRADPCGNGRFAAPFPRARVVVAGRTLVAHDPALTSSRPWRDAGRRRKNALLPELKDLLALQGAAPDPEPGAHLALPFVGAVEQALEGASTREALELAVAYDLYTVNRSTVWRTVSGAREALEAGLLERKRWSYIERLWELSPDATLRLVERELPRRDHLPYALSRIRHPRLYALIEAELARRTSEPAARSFPLVSALAGDQRGSDERVEATLRSYRKKHPTLDGAWRNELDGWLAVFEQRRRAKLTDPEGFVRAIQEWESSAGAYEKEALVRGMRVRLDGRVVEIGGSELVVERSYGDVGVQVRCLRTQASARPASSFAKGTAAGCEGVFTRARAGSNALHIELDFADLSEASVPAAPPPKQGWRCGCTMPASNDEPTVLAALVLLLGAWRLRIRSQHSAGAFMNRA